MTKLVDIPRFALTSSCFQSYCIFPRSKDIRGVYIEWVSSARMYLVGHLIKSGYTLHIFLNLT